MRALARLSHEMAFDGIPVFDRMRCALFALLVVWVCACPYRILDRARALRMREIPTCHFTHAPLPRFRNRVPIAFLHLPDERISLCILSICTFTIATAH
jgi:hypothetical protein